MKREGELPAADLVAQKPRRGRKRGPLPAKPTRVPESQPEREIFARNFRRERIERGLSQRDVHELTGVAQPHISEIENALHNVCIDTMVKLAQLVRKPVYELLKP